MAITKKTGRYYSLKLIVTNDGALREKYGEQGRRAIHDQVRRLEEADSGRGLSTMLVPLDDATALAPCGAAPVTLRSSERMNKQAIDKLFRYLRPEYLLILGGDDVVPFIRLENPIDHWEVEGDRDRDVPSDLPYACDAAWDSDNQCGSYRGPTRVVGRLPCAPACDDPAGLLQQLAYACRHLPIPEAELRYFAPCAATWEGATRHCCDVLFHTDQHVQLVPPHSERWTANELAAPWHFINCHGMSGDHRYYGEKEGRRPREFPALDARLLPGLLRPGTVVAAECCYGANLYDSTSIPDRTASICSGYLQAGAACFWGSTNIAYGGKTEPLAADLICLYFMRHVMRGASFGRAALQARQKLAEAGRPELSTVSLKTLAQFTLLGDPSLVAVKPAAAATCDDDWDSSYYETAQAFAVESRRKALVQKGLMLKDGLGYALKGRKPGRLRKAVKEAMEHLASKHGLTILSTEVNDIRLPGRLGVMAKAADDEERHYTCQAVTSDNAAEGRHDVILVLREQNGIIVDHRLYYRR
jgi:hypothetical protein